MARGDHVYVWCRLPLPPIRHHGIDCGDGTVIHYAGENGLWENVAIRRTSMAAFSGGAEVHTVRYSSAYPPDEVVCRAESRLGERSYNLVSSNCEHFARWCKTADHLSEQVRDAGAGVGGSLGAAALGTAGLGAVGAVGAGAGLAGGAATMTGLATVGAAVAGGAAAGIGVVGAAPALAAVGAVRLMLPDDEALSAEERAARTSGRVASIGGAAAGAAGAIGAVSAAGSVAGLSAAGITSGLAAIGGVVGGGMAMGLVLTTAAPAVAAVALGFGVYHLARRLLPAR
jgi:hypothetical protein